jgi:hypothetical protein
MVRDAATVPYFDEKGVHDQVVCCIASGTGRQWTWMYDSVGGSHAAANVAGEDATVLAATSCVLTSI